MNEDNRLTFPFVEIGECVTLDGRGLDGMSVYEVDVLGRCW